MKNTVVSIFGWNRRNFVLLALVLSLTGLGLAAVRAGVFAQDRSTLIGWLTQSSETKITVPDASPSINSAAVDAYPISGTFTNTLENPRVTLHQDGDTVVVMAGTGELPGTLTLKINRIPGGTVIAGGEFAFNVSYTEERPVPDPRPGQGDHEDFLVQRGTIKGTITGGQVTLTGKNTISSIDSIQLEVNGGSMTFSDAKKGNGSGRAMNILDNGLSTGVLTLTF